MCFLRVAQFSQVNSQILQLILFAFPSNLCFFIWFFKLFLFQTQGCSKCRNIIPLFQNFSYKYQYLYLPPTRPRLFRFLIIFSCFLLLYWLFLFEILHNFLWNHSLFFNFYHYASLHFFYFCSMTCEQLLSLKVKVTSVLSSSLFLIHITFIRN